MGSTSTMGLGDPVLEEVARRLLPRELAILEEDPHCPEALKRLERLKRLPPGFYEQLEQLFKRVVGQGELVATLDPEDRYQVQPLFEFAKAKLEELLAQVKQFLEGKDLSLCERCGEVIETERQELHLTLCCLCAKQRSEEAKKSVRHVHVGKRR